MDLKICATVRQRNRNWFKNYICLTKY